MAHAKTTMVAAEIMEQLEEAKKRGVIVILDNDSVHGYDEDERVVSTDPQSLMQALLEHHGVQWDYA